MYVCVCICVCMYIYIYTYIHIHTKQTPMEDKRACKDTAGVYFNVEIKQMLKGRRACKDACECLFQSPSPKGGSEDGDPTNKSLEHHA